MTQNEKDIYRYALRYALTKSECALEQVGKSILARKEEFNRRELSQMADDCRAYCRFAVLFGAVDGHAAVLASEFDDAAKSMKEE